MVDPKRPPTRGTDPEDEIEILEVVGVDEDAPPASADDDAEVEIVFEESAAPDVPSVREEAETVPRERFVRLQADFENLRKRTERERDELARYAAAGVLAGLVPVLDNLDRALAAARSEGSVDALRAGVEMIHRQLLDELGRRGLRPMETVGQDFDPERHEAVATAVGTGHPPNTVVEEIRRGYYLHERVLRPALVMVSVESPGEESVPAQHRES